jgi:hypothetical protein
MGQRQQRIKVMAGPVGYVQGCKVFAVVHDVPEKGTQIVLAVRHVKGEAFQAPAPCALQCQVRR